jgi:hypothetical protein
MRSSEQQPIPSLDHLYPERHGSTGDAKAAPNFRGIRAINLTRVMERGSSLQ